MDLWGVAKEVGEGGPMTGPDGKPLVFYSFPDAARWADDHA
ncbi:hypothetical protein GCM10009759_29820 [Kitasatospora saccharophila]|uniref:Uncharacterized protein n=1 Tax=Kitasatospora saccharophila TaxID=407973 RepID=A0ABN2WTT8_9ACTN